jgi:VanZ family protein
MAALYALSSRPSLPGGSVVWDKLAHGVAYALLVVLLGRALHGAPRGVPPRLAVVAALLAVAYGAFDEVHQSFVPGRTASWLDLVADAVGASLGAAAMAARRPRRGREGGV